MNLLQARKKFRDLSGRHDLVNKDGSDDGLDFFINEGRKFLDRLDENQKSWASYFTLADIGNFIIRFPYCRAIKEVWIATIGDGRWQLEKKSLQDLTEGYLTGLLSSRTNGTPLYYSPTITRATPETFNTKASDFEAFVGYLDIPSGNHFSYNSILISSPVSEKTLIEIKGLFYTDGLVNDSDKSYWSVMHPDILIMAAMRHIEITNRNTQGVNDWTKSIVAEMQQLEMDLVEELIAEVDQIRG